MTTSEVQELSEQLADEVSEASIGTQIMIKNDPDVVIEIVCSECLGTGEVSEDIDDGEGHLQRGVGTRKCTCKKEPEYESGD